MTNHRPTDEQPTDQQPTDHRLTDRRLIDHHCHAVVRRDLDRTGFELLLTEAGSVGPLGGSAFDSQIGFAVRRWCAPLLDLEPHAAADAYLDRRAELGHAEVTRRMLRAANLEALCVDTGFEPEPLLSPTELGQAAGALSYEIVRLEQVAEDVARQLTGKEPGFDGTPPRSDGTPPGSDEAPPRSDGTPPGLDEATSGFEKAPPGPPGSDEAPPGSDEAPAGSDEAPPGSGETAADFADGARGIDQTAVGLAQKAAAFADLVRERLGERARTAVGFKSIAAYRHGLDLAGERPSDAEVAAAARRWLADVARGGPASTIRLSDETLHRFLIWCGVDLGLPVQFHVGYGDADIDLDRGDPLLLTRLLRALEPTGVPVLLLHNYPFHRHAGYLAQVFSNVFIDVGLATHNLGHGSRAMIAEALELAPFGKVLYSSDAFALPELHYLGACLFRRGLADFLRAGVADDAWSAEDADRVAGLICSENARRVYRLK